MKSKRKPTRPHTAAKPSSRPPTRNPRRRSAFAPVLDALAALSRPALALVVIGAVGFTAWSFYPVMRVQYREEREYAQLRAEYESIQARNARLKKQVARLQTMEGVEDEAREDGLVMPGEHPVVVTDASRPPTQTMTQKDFQVEPERPVEARGGPWTPVLDFIFGVRQQ